MTLAPLLLMRTHPWMLDPWHQLSTAIKEGGTAFEKTHGSSLWEFASTNSEFNNLFNNGLKCTSKALVQAILSTYKDGFQGIETLVDVGGGSGYFIAEIVKANWPRLKGINVDLQHVVENAPFYQGVTHVTGDMFESIPNADAIILRLVLHNWNDEKCKKILQNCKRAISKTKGKLILVEVALEPEGHGTLNDRALSLDLFMSVLFPGGKERTQLEWTKLLQDSGFGRLKFIKTPAVTSIIEAYPS